MKIGITGEWIGTRAGGLETYCLNLINGLAGVDSETQFDVYTILKNGSNGAISKGRNITTRFLGSRSRWLSIPLGIPFTILKNPVDLLHATSIAPPLCPTRLVVTVHDLGHERHPEIYPLAVRYRLSKLISRGAKRAERVIAVSEATKQDLIEFYGLDADKITVIYEGVDERFRPLEDGAVLQRMLARYGIGGKYILYVGRLHTRKNLVRLLEAYANIRKLGYEDYQLVMVGRKLYDADPLYVAIDRLGLSESVVLPDHIDDQELRLMYAGATVFVYPSLFEGFGLPPLEAMASGIPVIASNISCMPEILGDAAVLFDPKDTDDLTAKLQEILENEKLRNRLSTYGLEYVKRYNWQNTARETLNVYKQVLSGD